MYWLVKSLFCRWVLDSGGVWEASFAGKKGVGKYECLIPNNGLSQQSIGLDC